MNDVLAFCISFLGQIVRVPGRFGVMSLLVRPPSVGKSLKWNSSSVKDRRLLSTCSRPQIPLSRATDLVGDVYFTLPALIDRRLHAVQFFSQCYFRHQWRCTIMKEEDSHAALTAYKTQMRVIFKPHWLHTRQDSNAGNSHAGIDYWRGTARRCVTWCYCGATARRCNMTREEPRRVKIVATACRLICHYLARGAEFFGDDWASYRNSSISCSF